MKYVEACEAMDWHLRVWKKQDPAKVRLCPFRCRSWRHPGECALWRGAQDFVRIRAAIASRSNWTYIVLTYLQSSFLKPYDLFRHGVDNWSILRKRLLRRFGRLEYIQTWERHKSGFPHVNVLITNAAICDEVCSDWRTFRRKTLEPMATAAGFGFRTWVEPMKAKEAMAGYLVKLARELTGSAMKDQTPYNAPRHFRRLRASRGLLPPPLKDEELTGRLVQAPLPKAVAEYFREQAERMQAEHAVNA